MLNKPEGKLAGEPSTSEASQITRYCAPLEDTVAVLTTYSLDDVPAVPLMPVQLICTAVPLTEARNTLTVRGLR